MLQSTPDKNLSVTVLATYDVCFLFIVLVDCGFCHIVLVGKTMTT